MNAISCTECGKSFGSEFARSWRRQSVHGAHDQRPAEGGGQVGGSERESGAVTVKEIARRAAKQYGSLDGFADQVVVAELVKAGLYERERGLTPAGEAARADLESRMAGVLREMQFWGGSGVVKEPRKALLAAVLAVALGRATTPKDADLQLVGQQVEQGAAMAAPPQETSGQSSIWLHWRAFDNFDRRLRTVDSEVDSGVASGDGSGGDGGDGGGGDGGGGD